MRAARMLFRVVRQCFWGFGDARRNEEKSVFYSITAKVLRATLFDPSVQFVQPKKKQKKIRPTYRSAYGMKVSVSTSVKPDY